MRGARAFVKSLRGKMAPLPNLAALSTQQVHTHGFLRPVEPPTVFSERERQEPQTRSAVDELLERLESSDTLSATDIVQDVEQVCISTSAEEDGSECDKRRVWEHALRAFGLKISHDDPILGGAASWKAFFQQVARAVNSLNTSEPALIQDLVGFKNWQPKHYEEQLRNLAPENDALPLLQLMVACNAAVDAEDLDGRTALYISVEKGAHVNVEWLISKGANVNRTTGRGESCLMAACRSRGVPNRDEVIELLLENGVDVFYRDRNKMSAIDVAAKEGMSKAIKRLVGYDDNVLFFGLKRGEEDHTPLHLAVEHDRDGSHCDAINALLNTGPIAGVTTFCTTNNETPLMLAAKLGKAEALKALITHDTNPASRLPENNDHCSALMLAVMNDREGCVELLVNTPTKTKNSMELEVQMHLTQDVKSGAYNALQLAVEAQKVEIASVLLEANKLLDDPMRLVNYMPTHTDGTKGPTALMIAAQVRCVPCVELLLKFKANPHLIANEGDALFFAVRSGSQAIVDLLMRAGVYTLNPVGDKSVEEWAQEKQILLTQTAEEASQRLS